jgi:Putative beta-barrel porin-2, OmpL-like. bbp2
MKKNITLHCFLISLFIIAVPYCGSAQEQDSIKNPLKISGYIEAYYNTAKQLNSRTIAPFIYNHNSIQSFAINLAYIKAAFDKSNYRASLALHTGTYVNANYEYGLGTLSFINEATVGIKLSKNNKLWLDAGIMPSHIGSETAIGRDNPTLTRSLMAELSPYYETGAKLTYDFGNNKGNIGIMANNGWQRIYKDNGIPLAWGTFFNYNFSNEWQLSYNTFFGKVSPDAKRFFNDLYLKYNGKKINLVLAYDYGVENYEIKGKDTWSAFALIGKYKFTNQVSVSYRFERFIDDNLVFPFWTNLPTNLTGHSCNIDYSVSDNAMIRAEYRYLSATEKLFLDITSQNTDYVTFSLSTKL